MRDDDRRLNIEYELLMEDVIALNDHCAKASQTIRKGNRANLFWIIVLVLFAILLPVIMTLMNSGERLLPWWIWLVLLVILWTYSFVKMRRNKNKFLENLYDEVQCDSLLGHRTVEISPVDISEISKYRRTIIQWPAVHRVASTSNHLFAYLTPASAFVVPKRAFEDESLFRHFADTAIAYHKAVSPGLCKKCGYNLTGNVSGRCPECGELY
ncbi:MAG: YcxB family protein [Phycisphaerales bacterium]|nr:YcxB family protein [Phycisphaerales bacterium]